MEPSEVRELKQLREKNAKLKRIVADLLLDRAFCKKSSEARHKARDGAVLDGQIRGGGATAVHG